MRRTYRMGLVPSDEVLTSTLRTGFASFDTMRHNRPRPFFQEQGMIRSDSRIRVTHQGTLPRPAELTNLIRARAAGTRVDASALAHEVRRAVADVVDEQLAIGIDSINDG